MPGIFIQGPNSCYNGVRDAGELGIDCGGLCIPCIAAQAPPCNLAENTASISSFNDSFIPENFFNASGSIRIIRAQTYFGYIVFRFQGTELASGVYPLNGEDPSDGKLGFSYLSSNNSFTSTNGSAYVLYENGELSITLCELGLTSVSNSQVTQLNGVNITIEI
jgi:hypothetical protein